MQAVVVQAASVVLASVMLTCIGCVRVAPAVRVGAAAVPVPVTAPVLVASAVSVPVPESPFADTSISFFVASPHLSRGELVIVRVCVDANRAIASADILESSGDRRFDQLAVVWARRVTLRAATTDGSPVAPCGPVRVEVHSTSDPRLIGVPGGLFG